jgi:hypothetical protein
VHFVRVGGFEGGEKAGVGSELIGGQVVLHQPSRPGLVVVAGAARRGTS